MNVKSMSMVGLLALGLFSFSTKAQTRVSCSSLSGRYAECDVGFRIRSLHLIRQVSDRSCTLGRSYGITRDGYSMWVHNGCRGVFEAVPYGYYPPEPPYRPEPPRPRPPHRTEDKFLTCFSHNGGYNSCYVGDRIVNIQLVNEYSRGRCIYGRSYGANADGRSLFVDSGCQAYFKVTVSSGYGRGDGRFGLDWQ